MLQELSQLVAGTDQQVWVTVHVNDEVDGLKQDSVLGVGVLHLLRLGWLLSFVQDGLETLRQTCAHARVLCEEKKACGSLDSGATLSI